MTKSRHIINMHGLSGTPIWHVWTSIKDRCYNKNSKAYKNYGGRGITMCPTWKKDIRNFVNDVGKKPSRDYTLDRIDNNKGYFKENVRWATRKEQNNNRRDNLLIEFMGTTMTLSQAVDKTGNIVTPQTARSRFVEGKWPIEDALTIPANLKTRKVYLDRQIAELKSALKFTTELLNNMKLKVDNKTKGRLKKINSLLKK